MNYVCIKYRQTIGLNTSSLHLLPKLAQLLVGFLLIICHNELPVFPQASFNAPPEIVVQTGPKAIHTLVLSPDGRILASAGIGNQIVLMDAYSGTHFRTIFADSNWIQSIAFSPDSKMLVSADLSGGRSDNAIELWSVFTGKKIRDFKGHKGRIMSVAYNPDGKSIASAGWEDRTIKIWEVSTGKELFTLTEQPGVFDQILGSALGAVTGENIVLSENWSGASWALAYSPDGKTLASAGANSSLLIWDTKTGKKLHKLSKHSKAVMSLAFSPDGRILASGSSDKTIRIWDPNKGKLLRTLSGHSNIVYPVRFTTDGSKIISGSPDLTVRLWDVETGKEQSKLQKEFDKIGGITVYPDGRTIAIGTPGSLIKLWDLKSNSEIKTFDASDSSVSTAIFSPDGRSIAIGYSGGDGDEKRTLKLWGSNGNDLTTLSGHNRKVNSLSFNKTGKLLASAGFDGSLRVWKIDTGVEELRLNGHKNVINSIAFSPNGKFLASGSGRPKIKGLTEFSGDDNSVRLWSLETASQVRLIGNPSYPVFCVAFNPDGQLLATAENFLGLTENKTFPELIELSAIKLWNTKTGKQIGNLKGHTLPVTSVAFSPNGQNFASIAWDKTLRIWDIPTEKELHKVGKESVYTSVDYSPDGSLIAVGNEDKTITLINPIKGVEVRSLKGHNAHISSVSFSPNGKLLVSTSWDATTRIWDINSGRELAKLIAIEDDDWLVVTPDGLFDGSSLGWKKILWRFSENIFDVLPVESFFNDYFYPGLLSEIIAGKRPRAKSEISKIDRRQPQLEITTSSGENGTTIAQRDIAVKINISNALAGAKDVRLFRNGSLVKVWRGNILNTGKSEATLETTIPIVAGDNVLTAYAFNRDNVKSSDSTILLKGAELLRRPGKMYVLAVGVNRYANSQYNLKYAVADAQAFASELQQQQSKLNRFSSVEVIPLLDDAATKSNILQVLGILAGNSPKDVSISLKPFLQKLRQSAPEDAIVFYFAGHGTAQQNRFYLIPHDLGYKGSRTALNKIGLNTILSNSISDTELETVFAQIDAGNLLLVIDACNSGQALETEEKRRGPMNSKGLAQLAYEKGMYILTAAQSYQVALEASQLGHGYLTYVLVDEGLKTKKADNTPSDGQIDVREWLNYATMRVPQLQKERLSNNKDRQLKQGTSAPSQVTEPTESSVQQPRIFYRREKESNPLIIAQ